MTERVSVGRRWLEPAPPGVPKSQWPRKRRHVWVVRWFARDGSRPQVTARTKAEADLIAAEKAAEFDQSPAARKVPRAITVGAYLDEFLTLRTGSRGQRLSDGTLLSYRRSLTLFAEFIGRGRRLADVTAADAARFVAWVRDTDGARRRGKTIATDTVNRHKRALKAAFNVARKHLEYLRVNPFAGIGQDKTAEKPKRYVTPAEFRALLAAAERRDETRRAALVRRITDADPGERAELERQITDIDAGRLWWQTFIALCYTAGTRLNEAVSLTWADVDFEADRVRIIAKPGDATVQAWQPKDVEARHVPVPTLTLGLLARMQATAELGNPYVFIARARQDVIGEAIAGGAWVENGQIVNNVGRRWLRLVRVAGIVHATIHDLRRACITNWARALPIHVVRKLAGHADIATTARYYLAVSEADFAAARQATEALVSAPDPAQTDAKLTQKARI